MIVEKIEKYIKETGKEVDEALRYEVEKMAGWAFKRQFMTDEESSSKGTIRLSSVGRCPRQVAYGFHGIEKAGKEMDQRAKIVFWMGDLVELTVTNLAKLAGCNLTATGFNQMQIKLPVNGSMISGHPDGILFEDKQQFLLEVKSMSSYGFEKFQNGDIDSAYLAQVNSYMEALGLNRCVFVGINKDSGVMAERVIDKDPVLVERIRENIKTVLKSTPENLPPQPTEYGPDPKGFYTWNCRYCAWWKVCRTNAEEVLVKNSYKLKEKTNGTGLPDKTTAGGDGNGQVGVSVGEPKTDSRRLGGSQENSAVGRNVKSPRPSAVESRSASKNVGSISNPPKRMPGSATQGKRSVGSVQQRKGQV